MRLTKIVGYEVAVPLKRIARRSEIYGEPDWESRVRSIIEVHTDEGYVGLGEGLGSVEGMLRAELTWLKEVDLTYMSLARPECSALRNNPFLSYKDPWGAQRDYEWEARLPGRIQPGSESARVGYFDDIFATAAELAGVKPPSGLDSLSFAPALLGDSHQQRHEFFYWEYHAGNNPTSQAALLEERWKGIRTSQREPLVLYDLVSDPAETRDVAAQHPDIVAKVANYLTTARGDSFHWPLR